MERSSTNYWWSTEPKKINYYTWRSEYTTSYHVLPKNIPIFLPDMLKMSPIIQLLPQSDLKYLGISSNLMNHWNNEYDIRKKEIQLYLHQIKNSTITPYKMWTDYHSRLIAQIRYYAPFTLLSEEQWK